jgi:hypothetical protein
VTDAGIALRGLARVPGLALTIVLSVGVGIGAATAIFAIIDAALLRPLPYEDPEQLVRVFNDSPAFKFPFSVRTTRAWPRSRRHSRRSGRSPTGR